MRREDYDIMHALEAEFWWFAGMRKITHALLSRHLVRAPQGVLDVGCGTGINLLWMTQQFKPEAVVGCDYSSVALEWSGMTLHRSASYSARVTPRLTQGDVRSLPFGDASFDLATSLDVLDQFPPTGEDVQCFRELYRVLRPGGVAYVREPAYQWLMCSHDTLFDTKHRYTTTELATKMSAAGFAILATTYANTILFPLAVARRFLRRFGTESDRTDTHPWPKSLEWLNGPFTACLSSEARLLSLGWRLPFGLSAISVGLKKG